MKTSSPIRRSLLLITALASLAIFSAGAQTTGSTTQITPGATATGPAKGIGAAPANSPQHQILTTALSPETRQTLQDAMNSVPAPVSSHSSTSGK
jgi:hypothetical protein